MMITHWTNGVLVLRGDRAKCGNRHADAVDVGDERTALVVQECASVWDAQAYLRRMQELHGEVKP